jgi:dATP pyrophosphohydrolase
MSAVAESVVSPCPKRPESVLVVVHTRDGKVLLLQRADNPAYWQSITGSLEWGDESPVLTAVRELFEETGIVVPAEALRDWRISKEYEIFPEFRYRSAPGVTHNTEHFFSLELPVEVPVRLSPGEHLEYVWVDFAAALARVFSWTNREAIEYLQSRRPREA